MKPYFIPSKLDQKLRKSSYRLLRTLLDKKLQTNGKLKNPEEAHGYIIEKYHLASGPRFIWKSERIDNKEILILRDALSHDEYSSKYNTGTIATWDSMLKLTIDEDKEFNEYCQTIITNGNNKEEVALSHLTDAESNFLNTQARINPELFKDTIYEKKGWLDYFAAKGDKYMANYGEALENLILNHPSDDKNCGWISVAIPNDDKEIIAVYHKVREESLHDWILFGVVPKETDLSSAYKEVFDPKNRDEDPRDGARRAYPFTMLEDKDYWQKMENDTTSNMILSQEESELIGREPEYPMFISGRAGSGKSTVLQYLFAEIIIRYLQSCLFEEEGESLSMPVYLSYSESLIEKAQELTESLFSHNHLYQKELKSLKLDYKEDVEPLIKNGMFCVFDKLVRNLIAEHNEKDLLRFNPKKRISFAKFKHLWEQKFSKNPKYRNYGPSICWHIIRTYIKGWDSSDHLSPEKYNNIGRDNKTVPDSTYKFVFDNIWNKWYAPLQDQGYWDDQDLVKFCLHPSEDPEDTCVEPLYSAVFCDESQDFTRIELELILGLSTLSHRTLNSADIYKIPFIFAGDEFQTLSPTGFSWNSLRSFFNKELARHLNIKSSEFTPSQPLQLGNNYRSAGAIVKLGNRLQLLRGARFEQPSNPQKTYFKDLGAPVLYFHEDAEVINRLKSKNLILIVPADDGMTAKEYIDSTSLKTHIEFYENGTPKDITILNPAQAKGLDYDNVAIYGFGNECEHLSLNNISDYLYSNNESDTDFEKDIDARYHLNNAYVAVTRAKERLFVIDSNIESSLWGLAIQNQESVNLQTKMISFLPNHYQEVWDESVLGYMVKGRLDDILDKGTTNWVEFIGSMEDRARKSQDQDLMEQAAARYKERGEKESYHRCLGYAYDMVEKYEAAAEEFLKAEMYNDAIRDLWLCIRKDNLASILKKLNDNAVKSDSKNALLASKIYNARTLKVIKDCLYDLSEGLNEEDEDSTERSIRKILAEHLLTQLPPKIRPDEISELSTIVNLIAPFQNESDFKIDTLIARLWTLKDYQQLIKVSERQKNKIYSKVYYKAKIELSEYPERLQYFEKAYDDWQLRVFKEYQSNINKTVKSDVLNLIIANAVISCSDDKAEIRKSSAIILSLDNNPEKIHQIMEKNEMLGIVSNKDALNLLLAIRQTNIEKLKLAIESEGVKKLTTLSSSARSILEVMSKDFKFDDRHLKAGVSNYFNDKFKQNVKGILTTPYLLLLGNKMEERRQYLDNIHYYEWAGKIASTEEKNLFSLLVLKNEELKDCNGNPDSFTPRVNKRREYGLGTTLEELDKKINAETIQAWKRIFLYIIEKVKDPATTGEPKFMGNQFENQHLQNSIPELTPMEEPTHQPVITETTAVSNRIEDYVKETKSDPNRQEEIKKFNYSEISPIVFPYEDLKISFNYQKGRLTISHLHSDQKITVAKNGQVRDDEDFVYHKDEEGRLELDGKMTNLSLQVNEKDIILFFLTENGIPTGVSIRFPLLRQLLDEGKL